MKRLLLLTAIALALSTGVAQTISGGIRASLKGLAIEGTIEHGVDAFGIRLGPILTARGALEDWSTPSLQLLGGVGATITPSGVPWGIQIQVLYRGIFTYGEAARGGPELVIAGVWQIGGP